MEGNLSRKQGREINLAVVRVCANFSQPGVQGRDEIMTYVKNLKWFWLCFVLWHEKLKRKMKLRNLGSMILVFKWNVSALRTFIKGIGCKSNNKRWRSWEEKSRGTDLAQNSAWVFSFRTTEMKMTINQMHWKWILATKISKCPANQEMS